MTEKRFTGEFDKQYGGVYDNGKQLTNFEVVDLLNEQDEIIDNLQEQVHLLLHENLEYRKFKGSDFE